MEGIAGFLLLIAIIALYFIPAGLAWQRKHHNYSAILLLNLFLGWTFFGWVIALVWAATAMRKDVNPA